MQQHIDSYDFTGKRAIVRVDFNVPLNENFEITDDTRIRRAMPTLKKVLEKGISNCCFMYFWMDVFFH